MKILLVAATAMEMKLLTEECVMTDDQSDILKSYRLGDMEFDEIGRAHV